MIIESIHNASYTCPFIQIERINHITPIIRPNNGIYQFYQQYSFLLLFFKRNFLQRDTRFKKHNRPCDVIPHLRYHFRIHHLKSILTEWTTIVIAVHPFAGRRTQQNIQALLDILLIRHHLYTVFCQRRRKVPTFSQKAIIVQYIILFAHTLHPPIITVGHPATIVPPCAVLSPIRAAGLPPIITVDEPFTIVSGGPTQTHMSPTTAAGIFPIKTFCTLGPTIGPPTCGIGEGMHSGNRLPDEL